MKRGSADIRFKSAVMALFFCLFLISIPITSFALDYDYLNAEKWNNSQNVKSVNINKNSAGNKLDGVFKFYRDCDNNCLYLYFFVEENTLKDYQDVKISLTVNNDYMVYSFSIDANGMCDQQNEEQSVFQVCQNFSSYSGTSSGLYMAAVQSDALSNSLVDIALYINGCRYLILESIKMQTAGTTAGVNTTARATQNAKNPTAKSGKAGTAKESTTKFKAAGGNAYSGTIVHGTVAQTLITQRQNTDPTATSVTGSNENITPQKGGSHLSKFAIILIIIASFFALAGVICIISAIPSPNTPSQTDDEEDEEIDE